MAPRELQAVYSTLRDDEGFSYIKVIDLASKVVCRQVFGQLPLLVTQLLMSAHTGLRPIYLTRAGHCRAVGDAVLERKRRATVVAVRAAAAVAAAVPGSFQSDDEGTPTLGAESTRAETRQPEDATPGTAEDSSRTDTRREPPSTLHIDTIGDQDIAALALPMTPAALFSPSYGPELPDFVHQVARKLPSSSTRAAKLSTRGVSCTGVQEVGLFVKKCCRDN